jgi:5'-nucleotidase
LYFVGRGVDHWSGYDLQQTVLGAEEDHGDVMVVKSGTDFRDLSEFVLDLEDAPQGSIRRKLIKRITGSSSSALYLCPVLRVIFMPGNHHIIRPGMRSNEELQRIIDHLLEAVGSTLKAPLCRLVSELDLRSQYLRTEEVSFILPYTFRLKESHILVDSCCKLVGGYLTPYLRRGSLHERSRWCRWRFSLCWYASRRLCLRTRCVTRFRMIASF